MIPSVYVYVDGESHFIRTEAKARQVLKCTSLEEVERVPTNIGSTTFSVRSDCSFVWDSVYLGQTFVSRKYYFTAFTGTDSGLHEAKEKMRSQGFDPEIIKEDKDKRKRRKAQIEELALVEKPKGSGRASGAAFAGVSCSAMERRTRIRSGQDDRCTTWCVSERATLGEPGRSGGDGRDWRNFPYVPFAAEEQRADRYQEQGNLGELDSSPGCRGLSESRSVGV